MHIISISTGPAIQYHTLQEAIPSLPDLLLLVSDLNMCQMSILQLIELPQALVLGEVDFGQVLRLEVC